VAILNPSEIVSMILNCGPPPHLVYSTTTQARRKLGQPSATSIATLDRVDGDLA
jgi:hypothetical protein